MKKSLVTLLVLLTVAALLSSATAVEIGMTKELNIRNPVMGKSTFMAQDNDTREYALYDATLTPVSDARFVDCDSKSIFDKPNDYYIVSKGELEYDLYKFGVINAGAEFIIPCNYNNMDDLGDGWFAGVIFAESTVDNYDYYVTFWNSGEKKYYLYDHIDLYKEGKQVATLARTEYTNMVYLWGEYLVIRGRDSVYRSFNAEGKVRDIGTDSQEYSYDFSKKIVTHNPTGIAAFTAGCTLTDDMVTGTRYEVDHKFLDLQGNVAFEANAGDYVSAFTGKLTRVKAVDGKVGVMDVNGNYVFPCQFDELYAIEDLERYGYGAAKVDGKYVGLRADGTITVETNYPFESVRTSHGYWAKIQDLDGSYRVISNEIGEFTVSSEDVYPSNGYALIKDENGNGKVYHYDGTLIADIANATSVESTADNRIAIVREGSQYYYGYVIEDAAEPTVDPGMSPVDIINAALEGLGDPIVPATDPVPAATEGWTCPSCGKACDGKFCPECGTPRPAEAACASCGYKSPDGSAFKFCPECGTPAA